MRLGERAGVSDKCTMAKHDQSSFRRILLSRILLLSVPVLLIGEAVTYKRARFSMMETARQNLTENAIRKGESINHAIADLKINMHVASQTTTLQAGTATQAQQFLRQLASQLPSYAKCIQLTNLQTNNVVANTCNQKQIPLPAIDGWTRQQAQLPTDYRSIHVQVLYPSLAVPSQQPQKAVSPSSQLQLLLSAPVYNTSGQLRYALSIQFALQQQEREQQGALAASTVIIAENETILAHPISSRIGRKLQQQANAEQLKSIIRNAISGRQDFLPLSAENESALLVGYTAIASPITTDSNQHWIIIVFTRLDNALSNLREIKLILFFLTVGLIMTILLATLYLARDLARPVEQLRDYALNLQSHHTAERVPHNFNIKELDQLAEALDSMVERLRASVEEIETAWEEAQAANRLKSEFLATTSHELRTPLNAIIGCVRLVRDGYCDNKEEEMEFLERANEAAIHLLGIINDLLDIARIEAGKLSIAMEPVDLQQVIKEVINLQSVHIQQKGLQLSVSESPEPIGVQADPAKLKQVLINVIGNAVKFTEQGSITIKTQIEPTLDSLEGGNTRVVLTVQDTGVGIDPAQQHKLFRPFVMVDGTTTRKFGGTGLGLAISRNLIEMMGGSILLCSAGSGQGTTVAIRMPVIDVSLLRARDYLDLTFALPTPLAPDH